MRSSLAFVLLRWALGFIFGLAGLASIVGSGGGSGGAPEPSLEIVAQVQDQEVFEGRTATFTIGANNARGYRWQRLEGANWTDIDGANGVSYSWATTITDNGRKVRVIISGPGGSTATSRTANLTVLAAAAIAAEPADVEVGAGSEARFTVVAAGASPEYRWQSSSDGGTSWADVSGATAATLSFSSPTRADDGKRYRVVVSNGSGSVTSRAALLKVFDPVTLVTGPTSQSVVDGAAATFAVVAQNAIGYQWQRLEAGTWTDVAGATAASYSFTATLSQDGQQWRVRIVGDGSGNVVLSNAVTLNVDSAVVPVAISVDPQSITVASGASATFLVSARGTTPTYAWQSSSDGGVTWANIAGATGAMYVIASTSSSLDGRRFRVIVRNAANSATSRAATLTVIPPVSVVTPPASQRVTEGALVNFTVVASHATSYQWQRLAGGTWSNVAGATAATYGLTASLALDNTQYRVVVSNAGGSVTSGAAVLRVDAAVVPVAITSQPQSATVIDGTSATFAVAASGTTPAFRWQVSIDAGVHWTDVPGATSRSLILPSVSLADHGKTYRVVVSNSASSAMSSSAVLSVLEEFVVASGGAACGGGGCGGDNADGSGVGAGDSGSASAGPGLSAMRNVIVTVTKPDGKVLGTAALGADYLVSLYPKAYSGPFIVAFADDGSGRGEYFDESLRQWRPLGGQTLHVMVPSLVHHISANPMTEAAYQLALRQAGSVAGLTEAVMASANSQMLAELNARLPSGYQTTDVTNFVVPINDTSGPGTLPNTWAGRYGAVMAALPIAGALYDSTLPAPALAFTKQLAQDMGDDSLFNASVAGAGAAYDGSVASQLSAGLCTAVSIWGSPALPSQFGTSAATSAKAGQLTLLAGTIGGAGNCDGWGSSARFDNPWRVAVDRNGFVYVADRFNKTVRRISPAGAVQTLAGSPGKAGSDDGVGLNARFTSPTSITVDADGNVYVGDGSAIRRITPAGAVTTIAGVVDQPGYADGTGSVARIGYPEDLAVDSAGNVYVADSRYDPTTGYNGFIRKVTPAGLVTTVTTECGPYALNVPSGVAVDGSNNIYIANTGSNEICMLTPSGAGSILIPGGAGLQEPRGLAVDGSGNLFVADAFNEVVRKVTVGTSPSLSTLAGGLVQRGFVDGNGSSARFRRPNGVAVDGSGNVYVADEENHAIRKITSGGSVSTLAGLGPDFGYVDATGAAARFYGPLASVADGAGNIYVLDAYNFVVRKITPTGGVSTLAGNPGQRGNADGTGSAAQFAFEGGGDDTRTDRSMLGMAIDSGGNLYVTDRDNDSIRRITPSGDVTTVASGLGFPTSVAVDPSGNLFVTTLNGIRRIDASGGNTLFASGGGPLASDGAGNVYRASNATIQVISPNGSVTTLAGQAGQRGTADGTGANARFSEPISLSVAVNGDVYVGEVSGFNVYAPPDARTVRKVTPAGVVTTVVGKAGTSGNLLGALPASLGRVQSVTVVNTGQIAISADDGVLLATFP